MTRIWLASSSVRIRGWRLSGLVCVDRVMKLRAAFWVGGSWLPLGFSSVSNDTLPSLSTSLQGCGSCSIAESARCVMQAEWNWDSRSLITSAMLVGLLST